MVRRILNAVMTLGVIGVVVIIAARVAEPSVRPILYPASVSPATTVVLAPAETSTGAASATTTTTTAAPSTTTAAPVATTTTTVAPVDEVAVLTGPYAWGPSVDAILLQEVLGVTADGWYGPATREAHLAENEARGLSVGGVPAPPTTTTTAAPATTTTTTTTTAAPATTTTTTTTTVASTTTVVPTTTVASTTTAPASTTTAVPTTTVPPPSTTVGMFGNLGAQLVAQLLGQPCIADGDLSDCGPEVSALIQGLVG